jgi:hypothetical protein
MQYQDLSMQEVNTLTLDLSSFQTIRNGATGTPVRVVNKKATLRVPGRSVTSFVVTGVSSAARGTGLGSGKPFSFAGVQSGKSLTAENGSVLQRTTNASAPTQHWELADRT